MRTHQKKNSDIKSMMEPRSDNIDGIDIDIDRGGLDSDSPDNKYIGITSISTHPWDPIGTILASFSDGTIRVWKSDKNEQVLKIIEYQAQAQRQFKAEPHF
jgi:hypothetical protein